MPNKENYFTALLSLIPVSFIAGNLIINLNILLLIISTFLFYKKEFFTIKYFFLDKLLLVYFCLIIIAGIYNDIFFYQNDISWWKGYFQSTIKSLLFLKYFFLYLVLRFLIERKKINLKYFFITCGLSSIFVCFDIFFQFINGQDIFGYKAGPGRKLSGPFGDELISGGFIQRFSIFTFFIIPLFFSSVPKNFLKILIPILFIIFFIGVVLSGNRMPAILFIFSIFLIVIFNNQTRKFFIPFVIILVLSLGVLLKFSSNVRTNFDTFYSQVSEMIVITAKGDFNNKNTPQYLKEFSSFYETWKLNKYIGGGIKNFRLYCHMRQNKIPDVKFICNMHPHNYYLEILTETGVVGLILILTIFLIIIYKTLYKKYFTDSILKI